MSHHAFNFMRALQTNQYPFCFAPAYGDNLECLCTYSQNQRDEDFSIGNESIVLRKYNYDKKQVYGEIIAKW